MPVQRGGTIRSAEPGWQSHGTLNAARDNVIVYPCNYTATHDDLAWLIGPDGVLDPTRWFIGVPDMFSNSVSGSAADDADFPPVVTMTDDVRARYRLLTALFDVTSGACACRFSMGAGQSDHWAALYPELVRRAVIVCFSARTSVHNQVFLSGLLRVLEAAPEHLGNGQFSAEPALALPASAHVYAGWGLRQDFYRECLVETALITWPGADISADDLYGGDLSKALSGIGAKVLLMPSETDLHFRVADNEAELEHLRHGTLAPIPASGAIGPATPTPIPRTWTS